MTKTIDYIVREKRVSTKGFILGLTDMAIQTLLMMAAFLMLTGFLYLIH